MQSLFAVLAIAMMQPASSENLEDLRGRYYAPPTATSVDTTLEESSLANAGPFQLVGALHQVDRSLNGCVKMREEISALIQSEVGSYAVHPDWLTAYQSCLTARNDELAAMRSVLPERKTSMMAGQSSEAAARIADSFSRLSLFETRLGDALTEEYAAQASLIEIYNAGGGLNRAGAE